MGTRLEQLGTERGQRLGEAIERGGQGGDKGLGRL